MAESTFPKRLMWVRFPLVPRLGSTPAVRWIANPEVKGSTPFPAFIIGADSERLMRQTVNLWPRGQVGSTPTRPIILYKTYYLTK